MNTEDINFAYRVRHALNEKLDDLPASTTQRLAAARQAAVARKKAHVEVRVTRSATATASAGAGGGMFSQPINWLSRFGVVLPLLMVIGGMVGVYQYEQQQSIAELAELDAALLSDELPLSAYLDNGFNAYLETREQ
ncbi:DUF3619 family protein [Pseudoduganella buxea]|uniref:DUF3619 family protein n=1 Tax=Pseudoduganella buxea TaxID=1949069 RepID=A0A6I3SZJ7_9BURK|nr:DUF3619 family protein [Pseudoduganella buxea]MTV53672.1 DUF3619 family protein [Pseudoduganella buxea]GGB83771.1 hypothetical protein GCM10011572_02100 [Pseudoduganella buxea]